MLIRILAVLLLLFSSDMARADVTSGEAFCSEPDADPVPLHRQPPTWPHVAILMCLQGTVVVEFTVAADGAIRDASVYDADQPGIFDRAALDAVHQWVYRPACQGGEPVAMQQRSALDFMFHEEYGRQCAAGAELLTDESLELAGSLGVLYSMLAEWYMHPERAALPEKIRAEKVAGFSADLGRVERFHHEALDELVALQEHRLQDPRPSLDYLIFLTLSSGWLTHSSGWPAEGLPDGLLADIRAAQTDWTETNLRFLAETRRRFAELQAQVNLEPELLDVLVRPFLGDVMSENGDQAMGWLAQLEVTHAALDLLEDPDVHWTWSGSGFDFADPEDGARLGQLTADYLSLIQISRAEMLRAVYSFMDYQP